MASQPKTKQAIATISRAIHKDALLEMVATGWTQQKIADHVTELTGVPVSQYYVCKTLQSFGDDYQAAKKAQAQYQAERVSALADKVEQGTLDPASARVASDNRKWVASKLDPSTYGDKVAMDVQLTDITQLHMQAMRDAMRVVNKD